jgi:hypothetical protein
MTSGHSVVALRSLQSAMLETFVLETFVLEAVVLEAVVLDAMLLKWCVRLMDSSPLVALAS